MNSRGNTEKPLKELGVLVQTLPARSLEDFERRLAERHAAGLEALSRPVEGAEAIGWGATVRDISATGIGLSLCFPFRPGTYLAADLRIPGGASRTLLGRVIHTRDQHDGTWHVGCELLKKLSDSDLELMT